MKSRILKMIAMSALTAFAACEKSGGGKASLPDEVPPASAAVPAVPSAAEATNDAASGDSQKAESAPMVAVPISAPSTDLKKQARGVHVISGQVFARQSADIGFQVAGFIKSVDKEAGDTVKAGDVMATLDNTDASLQLQVAEANYDRARAADAIAKAEFDREKQLKAASASSVSSFDQRRSAFDQAKAANDLADLEVKKAKLQLERTRLKAPFDGVISGRMKSVGEHVNSGAPVFSIVSGSDHEIRMQVPEQLLGRVQLGQKIAISIPAAGVKGDAEVIRIVPVISDRSRSFLLHARVPGGGSGVSPGQFVEAQVTGEGSH